MCLRIEFATVTVCGIFRALVFIKSMYSVTIIEKRKNCVDLEKLFFEKRLLKKEKGNQLISGEKGTAYQSGQQKNLGS